MWCWDQISCEEREQIQDQTGGDFGMSSSKWSKTMTQGGIFDTDPGNPWAEANKVYIYYCSSDAWFGDVGASGATYGYAFRGRRNIAATISDLVATKGLTSSADVLFGGCSAGARGAMVMLASAPLSQP